MFLKSLKISTPEKVIREIPFHKGVNLIVDDSPGVDQSGNNVGKTTILRLVSFCLGGKATSLYKDKEFGNAHSLKNFLTEKEVLITLTLSQNISQRLSPKVVIERNFLTGKKRVQSIDGETYKNNDFTAKLANLLFEQKEEKPSLRQLISKNIREGDNRLENMLKTLSGTPTDLDYEALYQFWFGLYSDKAHEHQAKRAEIQQQEKYRKKLSRDIDPNDFALLPKMEVELQKLESRREELDLDKDYETQLDKFDTLKAELMKLGNELSTLNLREELILESQKNLEKSLSEVVEDEIKLLYQEAKALMPDLQKTFKESVEFHNQMVENKIRFIAKEIPEIQRKQREVHALIQSKNEAVKVFKKLLQKDKTHLVIRKLNEKIQGLTERYASYREKQRIWQKCISEEEKLQHELAEYDEHAQQLNQKIQDHLDVFNQYFEKISSKLYGRVFTLLKKEYDENSREQKTLKFKLRGVDENPGTGEKKGYITAFDLAYIQFAEEMIIPHLNFIMHDQVENVDGRKIETIMLELVPQINCQLIVPILKDKIPEGIDIEKHKVVELSQSEKLFKF